MPTTPVRAHPVHPDHPVRGRVNAAFFRLLDGYVDRAVGDRKRALFTDLPAEVVEASAPASARTSATSAPARRSPPSSRTAACTPGCGGRPVARASGCASSSAAPRRRACRTPAPTSSCARRVLCTVQDPAAAVAEAARLLRPGGRLLVLEHVAAPEGSATRRLQRLVRPGWSWLFEGCQVDRDTAAVVRAAPFRSVSVDAFRARTAFLPVNSQIAVVAVR